MIVPVITAILLLQLIFPNEAISNGRYNSLVSAQCKARCLYEYRNHHHHHQRSSLPAIYGKTKRLLTTNALALPWRSIWERCPRLLPCNSCLLPCDLDPPLLLSNEQSCQAICSTLENVECQGSCGFVQNLYRQQAECFTDDCQSTPDCSPSDDCFDTPQPYNVTAIERKSRKTVRLKWSSIGIRNTEPIFYVIEAQWTLPKIDTGDGEELVSKWGFVKEEVSHTKAIIRNIQRDRRWYTFRVAAVTRHGRSLFSTSTEPFRLSSASSIDGSAKLPATVPPPIHFAVKQSKLNLGNPQTVNITLVWQHPIEHHLSISGYQISWELSDDPSSLVNSADVSSSLSPLELTIPFLSLHTSYLFKIRSMVITDGDRLQMSVPITLPFNYRHETALINNLYISEPYFVNGLIKANVSWTRSMTDSIQQYDLFWIETQCSADVISCCYRRDAATIQTHFEIYDLRFDCTYVLNVSPVVSKLRTSNDRLTARFNVTTCTLIRIEGTIRPPCQTDRTTIDTFSSLSALDLAVTTNTSGINLSWQSVHPSANGVYRLRIEQLPSYIELVSVDLPPIINHYFLGYSSNYKSDRYLNITLSLLDNMIIRQSQSILINDEREEYRNSPRNAQLSVISSSSSSSFVKIRYYSLLLLLFISIDWTR